MGVHSINPASMLDCLFDLQSALSVFSSHSLPVHQGAEKHTHTEAPTVAANWTDSLVIDLLQVSHGFVLHR